jgi:thiol-disulfide isomerase/thioredoxin
MKFLFLLLITSLTPHLYAQPLELGEQIPPLSFSLLGDQPSTLHSEALAGKVMLLDFWATWCGPCIAGMPHLDELQQTFGDQLQVIAISEEKQDRLTRFVENTDHQFLFAQDTGALSQLFPYRVIPHTVLINPKGEVVAITTPDNITVEVVEKVLRGESLDFPVKRSKMEFDPHYDYFQADTLTQASFDIQPYNPDLPSFTKQYNTGPFKHRRFTTYNRDIGGLYRDAYQVSSLRLEFEFDEALITWEDERNRYCMDIIVSDPSELFSTLKRELSLAHPVKARMEKRIMEVALLETIEEKVIAPEGTTTNNTMARGDGFSSEGATMEDFSTYLEDFGIFSYPVVDETGDMGIYKIDFAFDPENPETFKTAMEKLGLKYSKAQREIEVLVLYLEE